MTRKSAITSLTNKTHTLYDAIQKDTVFNHFNHFKKTSGKVSHFYKIGKPRVQAMHATQIKETQMRTLYSERDPDE